MVVGGDLAIETVRGDGEIGLDVGDGAKDASFGRVGRGATEDVMSLVYSIIATTEGASC